MVIMNTKCKLSISYSILFTNTTIRILSSTLFEQSHRLPDIMLSAAAPVLTECNFIRRLWTKLNLQCLAVQSISLVEIIFNFESLISLTKKLLPLALSKHSQIWHKSKSLLELLLKFFHRNCSSSRLLMESVLLLLLQDLDHCFLMQNIFILLLINSQTHVVRLNRCIVLFLPHLCSTKHKERLCEVRI